MNVAEPALQAPVLTDAEHGRQLRRAVIASTIGTTIEWYDFFVYGTVTALVFAKLYFPRANPLVGTLEAFSVYAVGFFSRPIGAAIFGHWGDRLGRKSALIVTLMLMGIATFCVGLVPTYASIGIWGAVTLTTLRCLQGIGVGGIWGGSVLLSMEWTRTNKHRGFVASWPQFGVPCGLFLSNIVVLVRQQGDRTGVPHLGLAHSIPAVDRAGGHRLVDPPRHPRDAGVPQVAVRSGVWNTRRWRRCSAEQSKGSIPQRLRTRGRERPVLYLLGLRAVLWRAGRCTYRATCCCSRYWSARWSRSSRFRSPAICPIASAASAST